jgi:hypothetical protein
VLNVRINKQRITFYMKYDIIGQLVLDGIIILSLSTSAQTWFIRYMYYLNVQLDNVTTITIKVDLPQT